MSDVAPDPHARIVILGGGHAGGSAAALLRQFGHQGPIAIVGEEPVVPYQRPPLSKAWLKGEADEEALILRPVDWYAESGVELRLNRRAALIDLAAGAVALEGGERLDFHALIIATGSRARRLEAPGADLPGVLSLRTQADAEAIKAHLKPGARVAVIGGGYVGLEVAASARSLGCEAVIIEREPRCLARVASETLSDVYQARHRAEGVEVLTAASVVAFEGGERVEAMTLADGRRIACDLAVVGVGGVAEDGLARAAGLACADGVVVDHDARASDPRVFAIGDVSRRPLPLYEDRLFRLESVPNALEQARQAAAALTGRPRPPAEVPWFWSDQYDLKLQIAGLPFEADRQVIRRLPAGGLAVFHLRGDRLRAVEAVNAPAEFMGGKMLILKGTLVDAAKLADPDVSIKQVAL
ncbi:NAD(P)/FAD-dependent oxidoreductase [Brevundimonas lutea]|uniref:NAD(P)/FAD-dependent oxidoreductase n=1 Tax=Brevundimonas lutea TaxID=2293980 RepID=UPI000F027980|nr:FAD-dependent oxidoreductase [Brevundimonas lutea]